ncbi:hypothetical protein ABIA38_008257 [Embleya sp. AB8]
MFLPRVLEGRSREGWPFGPYPEGNYHVFLAEDLRFGTFGHPWEHTFCVFGAELLAAIARNAPVYRIGSPHTLQGTSGSSPRAMPIMVSSRISRSRCSSADLVMNAHPPQGRSPPDRPGRLAANHAAARRVFRSSGGFDTCDRVSIPLGRTSRARHHEALAPSPRPDRGTPTAPSRRAAGRVPFRATPGPPVPDVRRERPPGMNRPRSRYRTQPPHADSSSAARSTDGRPLVAAATGAAWGGPDDADERGPRAGVCVRRRVAVGVSRRLHPGPVASFVAGWSWWG